MGVRRRILATGMAAVLFSEGCVPPYLSGDCSSEPDTSWLAEDAREIYVIDLGYNRGVVSIDDIQLSEGNFIRSGSAVIDHGYSVALFNGEGRKIFHEGFDFPIEGISEGWPHFFVDPRSEARVFVPRYTEGNGTRLEIYDRDCRILNSRLLD